MKCKHNWEKISEVTLPSAYEQLDKGEVQFDRMRISGSLFQKKYILVVQCKECGKLKKIVETNP